ncbi:hypothetical protein HanPSC8_Chr07g0269881 [Helianthus annuus]|nr:hypothetical protein HanPSC8_Chr07g0269881 [Helianthus annuus]
MDRKKKELVPDHKQRHKIEVKHKYKVIASLGYEHTLITRDALPQLL